ncbi:bacteriophage CII family protein [Klebsiella grimontii]|nr:bacteriophage CII family protein [Klebsiella grimontii]
MAPNSLGEIIKRFAFLLWQKPVVARRAQFTNGLPTEACRERITPKRPATQKKSRSLLEASLLLLRSEKSASLKPSDRRPFQNNTIGSITNGDSTARNKVEAQRIESWLHSQISELGTTTIAKVAGVNKSTVSRWRESLLPNMSLLLAILISNRPGEKGDFEA